MSKPLAGKVAFLTGGGIGIGSAIAEKVADLGASVVVTSRRESSALATYELVKDKTIEGQKHMVMQLDVTDSKAVNEAIKKAYDEYGRIDFLLNNAGVSSMGYVENLTDEDWDYNNDTISKGTFYCTRAALPYLKETKGRIVNTASMASLKPVAVLAHYTAAKYAVKGFTESCAVEFGPYGITVNCVCPGYVKTKMQDREVVWEAELRGMEPEEVRAEYVQMTPLGRLCMPEDVANVFGWLLLPESEFITGNSISVCGGAEF